jgi:prophage regulatory protein
MDVFLSQKDVCKAVTLCRQQIWRLEKDGLFPKRVTLGKRRVAWRKSEIDKFISEAV